MISVVGHADKIGSETPNQKLSEERALSVIKILKEKLSKDELQKIQIHFQGEPQVTRPPSQQGGH